MSAYRWMVGSGISKRVRSKHALESADHGHYPCGARETNKRRCLSSTYIRLMPATSAGASHETPALAAQRCKDVAFYERYLKRLATRRVRRPSRYDRVRVCGVAGRRDKATGTIYL